MATGGTLHHAFGLTWLCPPDCPDLCPAPDECEGSLAAPALDGVPYGEHHDPARSVPTEVTITVGEVPEALPQPRVDHPLVQMRPGELLFSLDGVGRFLVRHGTEIVVAPAEPARSVQHDRADASPGAGIMREFRAFLFGLGVSVVLHQRGRVLPVHASAVEIDGGAVLFAGYSGAGKSTLLAELVRRGYRMMADDVTAIELAGDGAWSGSQPRDGAEGGAAAVRPWRPGPPRAGRPPGAARPGVIAHAAIPQVKLWADAAALTSIALEGLLRVRPSLEKYEVPVRGRFAPGAAPVRLIYALTSHNRSTVSIEPLALPEVFRLLIHRTAAFPFLAGLGLRAAHFSLVTRLAPFLQAARIRRPVAGGSLPELADAVEAHLASVQADGDRPGRA